MLGVYCGLRKENKYCLKTKVCWILYHHEFYQRFQSQDPRNLGRRLNPNQKSLHQTDADFLKHYSRNHVDYDYTTISASSYSGRATCDPPSYRRFSRKYGQPQSGRDVSISTTTNDWFKQPHVPYSSSTRVLAVTQQPFPKHNPWKFSYKPVDKVYPPYDPTRLPVVDNIFNRYGAAFATSS